MVDTKSVYEQLTKEEYAHLEEQAFPYNSDLKNQETFIIFETKYALFDFLYQKQQSDRQVLLDLLQKLDDMSIDYCNPGESILDYLLNIDYTIALPSGRWIYYPVSPL